MPLKTLFSRQWWLATLLVLTAIGVMIRLGIWQLDRLDERRAFNARVNAQIAAPLLTLNADTLNENLTEMEYRQVTVAGEYDHSHEVGLRNQVRDGQLGVHLLTPLVIEGTETAVLVNRGWVPADAPDWDKFAEPGRVEVRGVIRASQTEPDFGGIPDPEGELRLWNLVNVGRIDAQASLPLLPIYIQQAPTAGQFSNLPYRTQPQLDLSEGSHFGYAMQWFLFATVLGVGYPFYVRDTQRRAGRKKAEN
jgi:surfeit locus 1 family protein